MAWVGNLYRAIWKTIGGRPWTFIMRDFSYQNPLLLLIGAFTAGVFLGKFWHWQSLGYILLGLLLGHLFWGTRYVANQREE